MVSVSSQESLKIIAVNKHMSFTVTILVFYESAVGSKELENDLLEMTRLIKSVPARALLNLTRP